MRELISRIPLHATRRYRHSDEDDRDISARFPLRLCLRRDLETIAQDDTQGSQLEALREITIRDTRMRESVFRFIASLGVSRERIRVAYSPDGKGQGRIR